MKAEWLGDKQEQPAWLSEGLSADQCLHSTPGREAVSPCHRCHWKQEQRAPLYVQHGCSNPTLFLSLVQVIQNS